MMHHNTKFGNKMFVGLEDIIWTNIDILAFAVTLTLTAVIQIFTEYFGLARSSLQLDDRDRRKSAAKV